jgi:hypothetical protein
MRQKQHRWTARDELTLNPKLAHMCDARRRRCICAKDAKSVIFTHIQARAAASARRATWQARRHQRRQAACKFSGAAAVRRFVSKWHASATKALTAAQDDAWMPTTRTRAKRHAHASHACI